LHEALGGFRIGRMQEGKQMAHRLTAVVAATVLIGPVGLSAQRGPDPHPDLQGYWTNSTATPLERPKELGDKAVFTPEEAARFEQGGMARFLSSIPEDQKVTAADLNDTYLETSDFKVVADRRTSLIIEPANGQLPAPVPDAAKRATTPRARNYDGPEGLTLDERCLTSTDFGYSTAAPPLVPTPFFNYYQIVQTDSAVVILSEGVHDARIIRVGGQHLPPTMRRWLGDSIGHWEGDTLVVDTTNYSEKSSFHGSSPELHVVERFRRVDANTISYRATVADPGTWTAPWTADIPFVATDSPIYEYACHEANYSMEFSLRGTRAAEREEASR
jgi:hypothetical protein